MRTFCLWAPILMMALAGGCPPEDYPTLHAATLKEVDAIRNNNTLTPNEKRQALAELGFSPETINALLRSERLANQYGGDLRSAYYKVVQPSLLSLTPDEIQVYSDEASRVDDALNVGWSDAQASAVWRFFNRNYIESKDDLQAVLDSGVEVPGDVKSNDLQGVFIDFDPDRLLPRLP